MKYRTDFVTNSSSASFVISRTNITDGQTFMILKYREFLTEKEKKYFDGWNISYDDDKIEGNTHIDNQDMFEILTEKIGIPENLINWSGDN